jgi:hypothetical protein
MHYNIQIPDYKQYTNYKKGKQIQTGGMGFGLLVI